MTGFPFDQHECIISIASVAHDPKKMQLTEGSAVMKDQAPQKPNGAWSYKSQSNISTINFDIVWAIYEVRLQLKRNAITYVLNILIPCGALAVLVLMVFCLPCESGEKTSFSVTTMLALTVFQMATIDSIPQTTLHKPVLGELYSVSQKVCRIKLAFMRHHSSEDG